MSKNIARLQYISQKSATKSHLQHISMVCEAGAKWVQLRLKNYTFEQMLPIAKQAQAICRQHQASFIINDNVVLCKQLKADGVHLGKNDMSPIQARQVLGQTYIIGATANTFADIQQLAQMPIDYIGLGPFRFTTTKKRLSPVLGLMSYARIIQQCQMAGISLPIVAIGGIRETDINDILQTGVHGIAASSLLSHHDTPKTLIKHLYTTLGL